VSLPTKSIVILNLTEDRESRPHQQPLTTSSPEPATNNHQHVPDFHRCSKPSRWWQPPRETRIPQQMNIQVPTRCKLTQMHLRSLNLALIRQTSKGDEWEGMCSAQKNVRESKCLRATSRSWPTSIYRSPRKNRAVGSQNSHTRGDRTR
jgi:hypothetical protein